MKAIVSLIEPIYLVAPILSWSSRGKIRFFYGDKTRLGLKTLSGRRITARGIKPRGQVLWQFEVTYFYSVVEPQIGESLEHWYYLQAIGEDED